MKKQSIKDLAATMRNAADTIDGIADLATDHIYAEWDEDSEVQFGNLSASFSGYAPPELRLEMVLTSRIGIFGGHDAKQKRVDAKKNSRAKAFVGRLLDRFKVVASRPRDDNPKVLRLKLPNVTVDLYGYPTALKFVCEKQCVAVLPSGKKVPIKDVKTLT